MTPTAEIIADSITKEGHRLTTFKVVMHRFVLAEFNTHRTLSRNSGSSRAIPLRKQVQKVSDSLAMPLVFPAEQKGMQGGEPLDEQATAQAQSNWDKASRHAIDAAQVMGGIGVHKSIANRLLEPFMWHTVVATGTAWQNFFDQRCSPLAQPEIKAVADLMRAAYVEAAPRILMEGEWHLPFVDGDDWAALAKFLGQAALGRSMYPEMARISAARCARTSYETQDGKRDIEEDLRLYERLTTARPAHWSPLEHVATPWPENRQTDPLVWPDDPTKVLDLSHLPKIGNLVGWRSLRTTVEAETGETTFR